MTAIAPVGAQVAHIAPAVEPVALERAVVSPSSLRVVAEMSAIGS